MESKEIFFEGFFLQFKGNSGGFILQFRGKNNRDSARKDIQNVVNVIDSTTKDTKNHEKNIEI
jgi:hypothetical protein